MLYQQQSSEDKGLFTFYREQAEREQQLKRQKKLKRLSKLIQNEHQQLEQIVQNKVPRAQEHLKPHTINHIRQIHPNPKPKLILPKQRLLQSIIDMGKDIDPQPEINAYRQRIKALKIRQPSLFLRRRYRQKQFAKQDQQNIKSGRGYDQFRIDSQHKRNQSQELEGGKLKQAIHSVRSSVVQLPEIKKPQEIKMPFRPKKSLKSKLIEEALHSRDKDKIKQIRTYLKAHSPFKSGEDNPSEQLQQLNERSSQIFAFKQQKLLGILKRFKRAP